MAIEAGETAPAFTLNDQDGNSVALEDFRGRTVVIFFYPKDNTPGCTREACGFRDNIRKFDALDTVILGVSPDAEKSHIRFIDQFNLPFTLLSDPDRKVMEQYGAWGEKVLYGMKRVGVIRSTTIVGPDGKVLKHWRRVPKAADHPNKVLEFLEARSA